MTSMTSHMSKDQGNVGFSVHDPFKITLMEEQCQAHLMFSVYLHV